MKEKGVPTVDLSKYILGDEAEKAAFVGELAKAFHEVGFVAVKNHGVSKALVDDFYAASKAFFALPVDVKKQYEVAGMAGQRGYTSFGKEHAKQSTVADLKEFYQQDFCRFLHPYLKEVVDPRHMWNKNCLLYLTILLLS